MPAFSMKGVTKSYGARDALSALDLELEEGHTLGLLGPNGAGKTTALRLLLGFCDPTEGEVWLRGHPPTVPESRRNLGYLPEQLHLPSAMTVARLLRFHASLADVAEEAQPDAVYEVMERVGIADRARDKIGSLSKGLRQRVGFAQAMLGEPTLLLLDEPTSGLDPIGIREARGWIDGMRERGCAILISSHVLSEVEQLCDQVAILHQGRLRAHGAIGDVLDPGETLEDAFVRVVQR
jgi:ABC-2 type transport system ATP-binding protein